MSVYNESEHVKETFAHFGRAYYMANVFESGLALAILLMDFLNDIKTRSVEGGQNLPTREQYEAEFEKFLRNQHAQTLGNLIKRAQKLLPLDDDFQNILVEVKRHRDFLAHNYFRERSMEFNSRKGRDKMMEELGFAYSIFKLADTMLDKITEPQRKFLGFSDEMLEEEMAVFMREASKLDEV